MVTVATKTVRILGIAVSCLMASHCGKTGEKSPDILEAVRTHFEISTSSQRSANYVRFASTHPRADVLNFPFVVHVNEACLTSSKGSVYFWWLGHVEEGDRIAFVRPDGSVEETLDFIDETEVEENLDVLVSRYTGLGSVRVSGELRQRLASGKVTMHFSRGPVLIIP